MGGMLIEKEFVPSRDRIEELESFCTNFPQIEVTTEHVFIDGMYYRKVSIPKDGLVVGKVHKKDHLFVCTKGEVIIWSDRGKEILKAGDISINTQSHAGIKRVVYALEDSVVMTGHRTFLTDLDEIEEEFIEYDPLALYDSSNKLKSKLLENGIELIELGELL